MADTAKDKTNFEAIKSYTAMKSNRRKIQFGSDERKQPKAIHVKHTFSRVQNNFTECAL